MTKLIKRKRPHTHTYTHTHTHLSFLSVACPGDIIDLGSDSSVSDLRPSVALASGGNEEMRDLLWTNRDGTGRGWNGGCNSWYTAMSNPAQNLLIYI